MIFLPQPIYYYILFKTFYKALAPPKPARENLTVTTVTKDNKELTEKKDLRIENKTVTTIIKKPFIDPIPLTVPKQPTTTLPSTADQIELIPPEDKEKLKKESERVKMRFKGFFSNKSSDYNLNPIPEISVEPAAIKPLLQQRAQIQQATDTNKIEEVVKQPQTQVQTSQLKSDDEKSFHRSTESVDSFTRSRRITVKTTVKCFLSERKSQRSTDSDEYKIVKKEDKFEFDDSEPLYKIVDPIPLHLLSDKPLLPQPTEKQGIFNSA